MNIGDVVALNADPEFRDNDYKARQYGRVVDVYTETGYGYHCGPRVVVSWSDIGMGEWTPAGTETYNPGCLRVL